MSIIGCSSAGMDNSVDPTAWYQLNDDELMLGDADADISISPDGTTLLIGDNSEDRLFFLDVNTGELKHNFILNIGFRMTFLQNLNNSIV